MNIDIGNLSGGFRPSFPSTNLFPAGTFFQPGALSGLPQGQDHRMSGVRLLVVSQMMSLMQQMMEQSAGHLPFPGMPVGFDFSDCGGSPPQGSPLEGFLGGVSGYPRYPGGGPAPLGGAPTDPALVGSGPSPLDAVPTEPGPGVTSGVGQVMDPSQLKSDSKMSATLLRSIRNAPVPPGCSPGYCYRGVKHHLRQAGVNLTGGSAYMAADQLARNPKFKEIKVSKDKLASLPAGSVVVWDRDPSNRSTGGGKKHGHISISTGDGREASDKLRKQMTNYGPRYRVFIPKESAAG